MEERRRGRLGEEAAGHRDGAEGILSTLSCGDLELEVWWEEGAL